MYELIDWPKRMTATPYQNSFLTGTPYFGPHAKILKKSRLILKRRSKEKIEYLWEDLSAEIPSRSTILDILDIAKKYLKWPNNFFVPLDKAAIVFGFIPGIWIDPEDILEEICDKIRLHDSSLIYKLMESIERDNLVTFFECLKSMSQIKGDIYDK